MRTMILEEWRKPNGTAFVVAEKVLAGELFRNYSHTVKTVEIKRFRNEEECMRFFCSQTKALSRKEKKDERK